MWVWVWGEWQEPSQTCHWLSMIGLSKRKRFKDATNPNFLWILRLALHRLTVWISWQARCFILDKNHQGRAPERGFACFMFSRTLFRTSLLPHIPLRHVLLLFNVSLLFLDWLWIDVFHVSHDIIHSPHSSHFFRAHTSLSPTQK